MRGVWAALVSLLGDRDGTVPAAWRIQDPTIATVDDGGAVLAQNVGETSLIASFWGLEAGFHLKVTCAWPERVTTFPGDQISLRVGEWRVNELTIHFTVE